MYFFLIAFLVLLLDQVSKLVVPYFISSGHSLTIISKILYLTPIKNKGAAFGIFPGQTSFFIVCALLIIILIIVYYRKIKKLSPLFHLGIAFQLGGAGGNLIDRIRYGYVIDFLDLRVWPVFNFADLSIVTGAGLILYEIFRSLRQSQK